MRTLVISDLHLGLRSGSEALRRPAALGVLLDRLDGVDRLVLLGDTLELRHGPTRDALATAEPWRSSSVSPVSYTHLTLPTTPYV